MTKVLEQLAEDGVAIWLDDLSRAQIKSGDLARMVEDDGVVGITTNPTIFAKAIGSGSGYEEQVRDLALRGTAVGEAVRLITGWDVRSACDVLRSTATRTGGRDGRVSIEVDPRIAQDAAARRPRLGDFGGWSTGLTCSSRSPQRSLDCPRSPKRWPPASLSM